MSSVVANTIRPPSGLRSALTSATVSGIRSATRKAGARATDGRRQRQAPAITMTPTNAAAANVGQRRRSAPRTTLAAAVPLIPGVGRIVTTGPVDGVGKRGSITRPPSFTPLGVEGVARGDGLTVGSPADGVSRVGVTAAGPAAVTAGSDAGVRRYAGPIASSSRTSTAIEARCRNDADARRMWATEARAGVIARTSGDDDGVGIVLVTGAPDSKVTLARGVANDEVRSATVVRVMKSGFRSASTNAVTEANRSSGFFEIAVRMAASMFAGIDGSICDGLGGVTVITCAAISCGVAPRKAATPVNIS